MSDLTPTRALRVFCLAPRQGRADMGIDAKGQCFLLACMAVIHPPILACTGDQQVQAVQVGMFVAAGRALVDGMAHFLMVFFRENPKSSKKYQQRSSLLMYANGCGWTTKNPRLL